jgi:hypothetical protein
MKYYKILCPSKLFLKENKTKQKTADHCFFAKKHKTEISANWPMKKKKEQGIYYSAAALIIIKVMTIASYFLTTLFRIWTHTLFIYPFDTISIGSIFGYTPKAVSIGSVLKQRTTPQCIFWPIFVRLGVKKIELLKKTD